MANKPNMNERRKELILIIDGCNLLHQSFHKFEKLKSTDGKPSGAIFGFFKSLHMYLARWAPDRIYITFDNGHSSYRDSLTKGTYKEHRKNIAIDFKSLHSQKAVIIKMLGYLRIPYVFDKKKLNDWEGDDFLAYLVLHNKGSKILIVSSDKDFNQLLTQKDVRIYNPRKDDLINKDNCKELFGYTPEETVDYLSMVGDGSDDIKGIPGVGQVRARKILDEYGSWDGYIEHHHQEDQVQLMERNRALIDLRFFQNRVPLTKLPIKTYKKKVIRYKKLKAVCVEYSLASFMTNQFKEPFNRLLK